MSSLDPAADEWVVEPRQYGVLARARELWSYRYLWWYFAANALKSMFRRGALGWFWLLMRVAGPVGLNALIFGGVLGQADKVGPPYFLFFLCGSVSWVMFERSLLFITRSVERNKRLITKVYFPRMILPFSAVAPALFYLAILLLVMIGTVIYYGVNTGTWYITLQPRILVSVGALLLSFAFAISVGLFTSVLQARYSDIRLGLRYAMPFWMYLTPIIYPLKQLPEKYQTLASLNPMTHIVEAFKWGTIGEAELSLTGLATSLVLIAATALSGMWFFNREEATSVDKL